MIGWKRGEVTVRNDDPVWSEFYTMLGGKKK